LANLYSLESVYFFDADQLGPEGEARLREALRDVDCVTDVRDEQSKLYIDINTSHPSQKDADKLVAIYHEFDGDLHQLSKLLGWAGMTANERLGAARLEDAYNAAKRDGNLDHINEILRTVDLRQDENGMNWSINADD
jgi:hypothetical protein